MPIENSPNIERVEAAELVDGTAFDLHKSDLISVEQMRAMTSAAFDAAATAQHVENHGFIDTPDVFAPTPELKPQTPSEQLLRHSSEWMRRSELDLAA